MSSAIWTSGNIMYISMANIRGKLAIWPFIGTKMAGGNKRPLKNTLSLVESDDKGIATGFYSKTQVHGKKIGFGPHS